MTTTAQNPVLDPIGYFEEHPEATVVFIDDPVKGYRRPIFRDPKTLEEIEQGLARELKAAIAHYQEKVWPATRLNLDTYDGRAAKNEALTLTFTKRDANGQHAWILTTIFSKDPVATCRAVSAGDLPYLSQAEMQIPVTDPLTGLPATDPMTGQPQMQKVTALEQKTKTTADFAKGITEFLKYRLEQPALGFYDTIYNWVFDALKDGNTPAVIKNIYEPRYREQASLAIQEANLPNGGTSPAVEHGAQVVRKVERVMDGEPNRIELISRFDFIMPPDQQEATVQTARWCGHIQRLSPTDIRRGFADGTFNLCRPPSEDGSPLVSKEEIEELLSTDGSAPNEDAKGARFWPEKPSEATTCVETWFYLPVPEPDGTIQFYSLCATVNLKKEKFLNCYANYLITGERPFEPLFMRQRSHEFSGSCAVEDALPYQRAASLLMQGFANNLAVSNSAVIGVRKGSATWNYLNPTGTQKIKVKPNTIVPYDDPEDLKLMPLGQPVNSSMELIFYLDSQAQTLGSRTDLDRGAIPSRTPAQTYAQATTQARLQPSLFLETVRMRLAPVLRRYVQIEAQFNPYGVVIPMGDAKTNEILQATLVNFPAVAITDQFAINITATAEDETPQAKFEKDTVLLGAIEKANAHALMQMKIVLAAQAPPPAVRLGMLCLARYETVLDRLLSSAYPEAKKLTLDFDELETIRNEMEAWAARKQIAAMYAAANQQMPMQGGMNANALPAPGAEGAFSGPEAGSPGSGVPGEELGMEGGGGGDQAGAF